VLALQDQAEAAAVDLPVLSDDQAQWGMHQPPPSIDGL